ncbi:MAG TPA: metal-dependent hydrolase [Bryobacteraceae bacterium]|nr:metal-dependent hydrolase [Bryobacteraceae bacterium]
MDPLTHSLTGVLMSRAGFDRLTPRAPWIMLLAANAPDCDIVSAFGGSLNYLHYHRHITHSLAMLPVLPVACVLLVRLVSRKPLNWLGAYFIALIGVASHLVLDLTNIYGVRLLLPFSGRWLRWDITGVIDFWIWAVLLLAIFAPMVARLVNAEIGAATQAKGGSRRGFAIFALVFLMLYDGARAVAHARAVDTLESRIYNGSAPRRVAALASQNPFRWHGLVETHEAYVLEDINLLGDFDPTAAGHRYYKPEPSPAFEAASRTEVFQEFARFSQYPFWQMTPSDESEGATRVEALDLRFGDPQEPGFVATAILDARLQVMRAWFQFGAARPR